MRRCRRAKPFLLCPFCLSLLLGGVAAELASIFDLKMEKIL